MSTTGMKASQKTFADCTTASRRLRCVESVHAGSVVRREAVVQSANVFWLAFIPVVLINFLVASRRRACPGIGARGVRCVDRVGAFVPVALLREGGPLISGAVMAGTIGTTITAELGARVIRQEIEALQVMGSIRSAISCFRGSLR